MPILKCKMCGGDLNIEPGITVCECEYCSTKQTVPTIDNEKKVKLFERANRLRMSCQFDKAANVFESIIEEFDAEAEGYWGLLLCKYGIEYVDDPATGDKIPTCHRSSFDSFIKDPDFDMVMENCDALSRNVYREQAKQIEEIRKGIIEVSGKEEPYDIFICYKETAEDGQRTIDSVLAQDIYDALTEKGYRVFFSRITLEDKLGTEYEPYIFAALNSAKVMLAFGTSYDYYNAVWVKNEWSRYLKLMTKDKDKYLIPCYKNIDAYDIPEEFAKFQAQDLGKVGATQDLLRGIEKILPKKEVLNDTAVVPNVSGTNVAAMIKRGNLALEDKQWDKADTFFEEALNQNPECAEAYLGKLMVELSVSVVEQLKECNEPFDDSLNYKKAMRFGSNDIKTVIEESISVIKTRINEQECLEEKAKESEYQKALFYLGIVHTPEQECEISEENQRHEEVISGLKTELIEAERNAKEQEVLINNEKTQITNKYKRSEASLRKSLDETVKRHNQIRERKKQELSSLGIFAGKRKNELIQEIQANRVVFSNEEADIQAQIDANEKNYQNQMSSITNRIKDVHNEEVRIKKEIESENILHTNNTEKIVSGNKDFGKGVQILEKLGDYKDSNELKYKCSMLNSSIGDIVTFGKYEWKVLNICDNKMLLIANDAVSERSYNNMITEVTWSSCSLRSWLNDEFINETFSSEEQSRIMTTTVSPGKNLENKTDAGSATKDKIFLLSIDEVNQYFRTDSSRRCEYNGRACWWWLRSPGIDQYNAAGVNNDGSVDSYGCDVDNSRSAVRPALWINLES